MISFFSKIFQRIWLILSQRLTLMLLPHNTTKPWRLQISLAFLLFSLTLWTGITTWAALAVSSNVDYWRMKGDYEILKVKVILFSKEIQKNREFLDQVKEVDAQLRQMLKLKDRNALIQQSENQNGQGGPEAFEQTLLVKTLNQQLWSITASEFHKSVKAIHQDSQDLLDSYQEITKHVAQQRFLYRSMPRGMPARGRITSRFGNRMSPLHGSSQFHTGIDIANLRGTPIIATGDGIVIYSGWEGGYGRLVTINHGMGYLSLYGHNSKIVVKKGNRVRRGQVIAYMGSSGSSTGNHVHYEIWKNGKQINPYNYIKNKIKF